MVHQYYQSEVNNEYVIRGNAAILKCSIPSFVTEFVQVIGWQDDQGNSFDPDHDSGTYTNTKKVTLHSIMMDTDKILTMFIGRIFNKLE